MSNGDFITSLYPYASRVSSMTGLDPRLILAQAALETGWGRSAPGQNYFGIKGGGGDGLLTTEYVNGRPVQVREPFRSYESPEQSFLDYANLMMRPRYEGVRGAGSLEAQAEALQAAGYATDPEYAAKLIQIASNIPQSGGRAVADRAMMMLGRTQPRQAGAVNMDNLLGFSPVNDQPAMRQIGRASCRERV
jgi:flagellum-specific peptidoglycan hydrolase FlgJ